MFKYDDLLGSGGIAPYIPDPVYKLRSIERSLVLAGNRKCIIRPSIPQPSHYMD
jgi:hypothetical protein